MAPLKDIAAVLFAKIKADDPFSIDSGTGRGSVADPSVPAEPAPAASGSPAPSSPASSTTPPVDAISGVLGQTAADYTCSKVNK